LICTLTCREAEHVLHADEKRVGEARLETLKRPGLAQVLADKYSRDVDLIDLKQASTVMRMQVISSRLPRR
jgi:hypothetical protein